MFEKFGEFDTVEELNAAAEGLKQEGDTESLIALAEENGLDKEDAQDYIDGCTQELANELMAAWGKLNVECNDLKPYEIMEDWVDYIKKKCTEEPKVARAVRSKRKSLKGCIAVLLKWSLKNAKPVDGDVMKAAGVNGSCKLGIPGMGTAKKMITEYYLEG